MAHHTQTRGSSAELAALFEETVALYHRLTADAAAIHRLGSLSGPRRTVLLALARTGPQTVAHMARARAQSRQRFQPLVNALMADGLIEPQRNPMHKRSHRMALTAKGRTAVKRMVRTESALRSRLELTSPSRRVGRAAAVLREVRLALETQMPQLLRGLRRR